MSHRTPTYEELERRCEAAEAMLAAIRSGQTDTIIGEQGVMVLRLAEAEEAVRLSRQRLGLALEAARSGTWEWDLETNENFWSEELWAVYGLEPHSCEPSFDAWQQTLHPDDRAAAVATVQTAATNGSELDGEWRIVKLDGEVHWLMARGRPLYDAQGKVVRYIGIVVDITERKRAEAELQRSQEALRRANEQLAEADRSKDEFLATLAHELRNPLAAIRFALTFVNDAETGADARERGRQVIARQTAHMARLIEDLLDVSRIVRKKIQIRKERVDVAGLLEDIVESAGPGLAAAGHRFVVEQQAQGSIDCDPVRMAQVVGNLLNNAAKFTPAGDGVIALTSAIDRENLVIRVRDNGVGITPEHLPHVFDMFHQAQSALDRSTGGLGIGLAIAKSLVELHDGSLTAVSNGANTGAEFTLRLPLAETMAPSVTPVTAAAPLEDGPARSLRVLIVEDNVDTADLLNELLRSRGHVAQVARDGASALAAVSNFHPEVVLLDIGLPQMDGYEVAREMRRVVAAPIRLIALTGWGQTEDRRKAREAGFDYHITKPADLVVLLQVLQNIARRTGSHGEGSHPGTPMTRSADSHA